MSRTPIATVAGLAFVGLYIAAAVALPELLPRVPWYVETLYWAIAGVAWVFPVRWLMLWAAGRR